MATISYQLQGTLLGVTAPGLEPPDPERVRLDATSWVDLGTEWLAGADEVFAELARRLDWRSGRRPMYERMVDVPRLVADVDLADTELPPVVGRAAEYLSATYDRHFDVASAALYRGGDDSVAWHSDRIRHRHRDPIVALLVLGGRRPFLFRPRGGGSSTRLTPGEGDLLVMGGRCQFDWEHTVPKVSRAAPRMSIAFRHGPHEPAPERSVTWR